MNISRFQDWLSMSLNVFVMTLHFVYVQYVNQGIQNRAKNILRWSAMIFSHNWCFDVFMTLSCAHFLTFTVLEAESEFKRENYRNYQVPSHLSQPTDQVPSTISQPSSTPRQNLVEEFETGPKSEIYSLHKTCKRRKDQILRMQRWLCSHCKWYQKVWRSGE